MKESPQTDEGWFALHDFRDINWEQWRDAPERVRETALADGTEYFERYEQVTDAQAGQTAIFSILGHKADLLILHFRPAFSDLDHAERAFEQTSFADFTEQTHSYVSVTEVSGYVSDAYFKEEGEVDEGLKQYIEGKLKPDIPDDTYMCFYPMSKRRQPEYNWYDLDFEHRAELMEGHGKIGRKYGGSIKQVIASSIGLDDWEWGVTLFGDDPIEIKDIVYDMRFDEASSKYADFGQFFIGRRIPPSDLRPLLNGETVPTDQESSQETSQPSRSQTSASDDDIRAELSDLDIYAGQPHDEDVYALVSYSTATVDELEDEVYGLRENFDHYDTHVKTAIYEKQQNDTQAIVSIWETESAADTASGFLADLPGTDTVEEAEDGWGTMGMFYQVKSEYRDDFLDKFADIEELLEDTKGHRSTSLYINREDNTDMFIASHWDSKEDAMQFFRSEEFSETVSWGRDVLVGTPRHVFLA
ncbi:MAG: heme-binding protein [Halobacteriaceae archaeon]